MSKIIAHPLVNSDTKVEYDLTQGFEIETKCLQICNIDANIG